MFPYRALALLPLPALYLLSSIGYFVVYRLLGYRRDVVRENLRYAFPDMADARRRAIEKNFYRHLLDVAFEIVRAQRMSLHDFSQRVHVDNPELLQRLSENYTRPVLVLTIHQGNWEWMLHAANAALGVPLDPVYKPLHNAGADRFMSTVRSRFGARPLALKSAARDILGQRGRCRLLVLVADQSPTRREKSLWTTFLHRPAAFHTGAEALARRTGYPVVFARCRRRRRGHYSLHFLPLSVAPRDEAEGAITRRYAALAEQAIREEPESWLWSNRRWKRQPDESPGDAAQPP